MEKGIGLPIINKSCKKVFLTNDDIDKIGDFMRSNRRIMQLGDKTIIFVDNELHIQDTPPALHGKEWPPVKL